MHTQILKKLKAFSLVEIIVVVVILSVITSFAYSKYTKFIKIQEMKRSVQNLMTIYQMAKILEIRTGRTLYDLLPSSRVGLGAINTFFTSNNLPLNLTDSNTNFTLYDDNNPTLGPSCIQLRVLYPTTSIYLENPHCLDYLNAPTPTPTCSPPAGCYNLYPAT